MFGFQIESLPSWWLDFAPLKSPQKIAVEILSLPVGSPSAGGVEQFTYTA